MRRLWVYDDLWEEGYRFDDVINNAYVMIKAKNEYEAIEFLSDNHNTIKVNNGSSSSKSKFNSIYCNALCLLV
ncbi:MAG: hypothetical protein PF569_04940 [Candidatus Woesearchaeota archaeon]|jgi:hypothetical protein|nr:hypothetical protein [Candidatus Woesearchaeota archaeon]